MFFSLNTQALQKELGSRTPSFNSVMKEGNELMKSKTKEGRVSLRRKLADLKQDWEVVCNLSVTRQQELQEIERKMHQFEDHLKPVKAWLVKLLPSLDSTEPVHGDFDTVSELLELHTVRHYLHNCYGIVNRYSNAISYSNNYSFSTLSPRKYDVSIWCHTLRTRNFTKKNTKN